jgi:glycosyltransferase involved in cell wall biosynthesis
MAPRRELNLLHVVPYFEQAWGYGGIPRAAAGMVRGLVERGHRVTVCTTDACDATSRLSEAAPNDRSTPAAQGLTLRIFRNVSNRAAYRLQFFTPRGLRTYLDQHVGEFDLAHLHGCHHLPGALAARALLRHGIPYVVTPNGTAPRIERRRFWKLLFDTSVGSAVLPGASRVLAVSAAEERVLAGLGIATEKLRRVPNPLDLAEFEALPVRGALRQRLALGDAPVVLYLGTMSPRKGVAELAQAFAGLDRGARLVIAGNDFGSGGAVRRVLTATGRAQDAVFTGVLRGRERLEALVDADVVAYVTRDEAFGLVPLEALLCGTPVVVGDDAGCGELLAELGGGLAVAPGDTAALTAALRTVLAAPEDFRRRVREAAIRIRARFGREQIAAALEAVYDEVLERRPEIAAVIQRPQAVASGRPAPEGSAIAPGVTFVVPVYNGEHTLAEALASILAQDDGRPFEVLAIDDGSSDSSAAILTAVAAADPRMRVLAGAGRGAAAAINLGVREARHPIICQVDQDVVLRSGWMPAICRALDDPAVAAAQGYFRTPRRATLCARVMGLDLELRYIRLRGRPLDHVCTGNSAYRAEVLGAVGGFDENLGYGYDNDLSYRLSEAGHRLAFATAAESEHRWRESLWAYLRQQYGVGYGRLDLMAKHPKSVGGDEVSGLRMIIHVPGTLLALLAGATAAGVGAVGGNPTPWALVAGGAVAVLALDRAIAGIEAAFRFRSPLTGVAFPFVHALRDLTWVAALGVWGARRLAGRASRPGHSMRRRAAIVATQPGKGLEPGA